ncbi:hypothetical protein CcaCcLH18_03106 [Colletotrichum camelliae]|nr:hypothetical protein CcaCcLH18_03106 [Colletotrichum camelliae]
MPSTASEDEIPAFVSETPVWRGRQLDSFHPDFGNDRSVMEVLDAIPDGFPVNSGQLPLVRSSFRLAPRRPLPSGIESTGDLAGTQDVSLSDPELDQERFKQELASLYHAQRCDGEGNALVYAYMFDPDDNNVDSNVAYGAIIIKADGSLDKNVQISFQILRKRILTLLPMLASPIGGFYRNNMRHRESNTINAVVRDSRRSDRYYLIFGIIAEWMIFSTNPQDSLLIPVLHFIQRHHGSVQLGKAMFSLLENTSIGVEFCQRTQALHPALLAQLDCIEDDERPIFFSTETVSINRQNPMDWKAFLLKKN